MKEYTKAVADKALKEIDTNTRLRGDNNSEYLIYVAAAEALGWNAKSYDEWLTS